MFRWFLPAWSLSLALVCGLVYLRTGEGFALLSFLILLLNGLLLSARARAAS